MKVRPLLPADIDSALALVRAASPAESYTEALLEVIAAASAAAGAEASGLAAERGGELVGVAVYGEYAGTVGAGRLHLVAVDARSRRLGVGAALLARAVQELSTRGARLILAEIPDDAPALRDYRAFLVARSFDEEARVPDLFSDGVALSLMRRSPRVVL